MSGIEIKIDKEAVERQVVQAVIDSAIGDHIEMAVHKAFTEKENGGNAETFIERAVRERVLAVVGRAVQEQVEARAETVRIAIADVLTKDAVAKLAIAMMEHVYKEMGLLP